MSRAQVKNRISRVDVQVSIFTAVIVVVSCVGVFAFHHYYTYRDMIGALTDRVYSIYSYLDGTLDKDSFTSLRSAADMSTELYQKNRLTLANIKQATGVLYLYTATRDEAGDFIYLADGLPLDAADFRRPGDLIEPEIVPELERALAGEEIMPDAIKATGWGKIFISYLPIHSDDGSRVVGVVGIEFDAAAQYDTYTRLLAVTPFIVLAACLAAAVFAVLFFRRISNPTYRDLYNTDQLTHIKNRNAFTVDLENLSARREASGAGLLLLDLNDLKQVNDSLGHDCGDLYLQDAAWALTDCSQGQEVPYRIGGDEFALLVPRATPERMEALQRQLEQIRLPHRRPADVSFSVGWAIFDPLLDHTLSDTCRRADERMYQQKHAYHQRMKKRQP